MASKYQIKTGIEIGSVKLSMMSDEARRRFHLGLIDSCKQFFKDPKNLAEFLEWKNERRLKAGN